MSFISYAQNFEDIILWRALKHVRNGFYIDVGANDPAIDSVTKSFYDQGWSGINIEPLISHHADLQQERPRDINLQCAAGEICGEIELWECDIRGWATSDKSVIALHEENGHVGVFHKVPVLPLSEICNANVKGEIHFLKIDVEGFEKTVLEGMDFSHFRPWVLVLEATRPNSAEEVYDEWENIVLSNNYLFAYTDRLNRFYVASEHSELLDAFHYPPNVFDDFISVKQWTAVLCMQQAEAKAEKIAIKLTERNQEIDELQVSLTERATQQQALDANLQETTAQREQLKIQTKRIQDEAVQREEKLREKETKQQELLLSLLEKETRLQEAATKLTERKQEIDELQVSLTERTAQQQALDANLQETTAQREQLKIQMERIQDEAVQREELLREKGESNNWLNNEWNAAKQKVDELYQSNHHWWSMADQQSKELEVRQAKIEELNHSSHHWWLEAERLTKELQTVHNSTSWRITWPLRKLMQFFKWLLWLPIRLALWLIRLPKRTVRWLLVKMMSSVIKHPALKVRAMNWLHNYPNLKEKLRRLAPARGLIASQQNNLTTQGQFEPTVSGNQGTAVASDPSPLTPNAHRIYGELKAAIAQNQKENS